LCALFGLQPLSETMLAIEDAAEANEAQAVSALLVNLPAQVGTGVRQLRHWLEHQKTPPVV